ncbi:MAG: potassium transporter TrkG, partial [Pacificimonas sp.]
MAIWPFRGREDTASTLSGRSIGLPPPALLALLYASLATTGMLLLMLPFAAARPESLDWTEALFMAVSAITVTGLIVVDTGSDLSVFGEAIIMILIQLGGLGLMTFATLVLSSLGLPIGFEHRVFLREDLGQTSMNELTSLVCIILRVVLLCELAGVVLLSFVFVPDFGWAEGLWQALFHSISAFNNAGFSLFSDSLTGYATDPIVNLTVPGLFIIGGLGFGVLSDLGRQRAWQPLTLHSKLMLVGTLGLTLWAFVMFAWLEWSNPATLGLFSDTGDKLWVTWFQATTPRTAGFNTADYAAMRDPTTVLTLTLMFIGGGPTSTAGGIKVTTFIVLLLATYAFFRRRPRMRAFGRSLGFEEAMKVMALLTISGLVIITGLFILSLTYDGVFIDLVFETVSAFGTVG